MTRAKNLPDVWVVFGDSGIRGTWRSKQMAEAVCLKSDVAHRYTPAKPANVCKCKEPFSGPLCLYCANCGGKVKR